MSATKALIPGVRLNLGGRELEVPPLNLRALEKYWPLIEGWAQAPANLIARLGEVAELLHIALQRNYPDLSLEEVKEGLDFRNFQACIDAIMGSSGLVGTPPGEPGAGSVPTGGGSTPG